MTREFSAGVLIFRNTPQGREYLLLHYPGLSGKDYWDFPKGHLEEGETAIEAALREVQEETGLSLNNLIPSFKKKTRYFFRRGKNLVLKEVSFFLAEAPSQPVSISAEHIGFGWFDPQRAKSIIKFKNDKKLIDEAEKFLCQKSSANSSPDSSGKNFNL